MKAYIYPYKLGSASAKALAAALDTIRIRSDGKFKPDAGKLVVNWGNSSKPQWNANKSPWLNYPHCVDIATNKSETFGAFSQAQVPCVDWTISQKQATKWVEEGSMVLCRTSLGGHSGKGIVIAKQVAEIVPAPLYTKYKKKAQEFRVHVFQDKVIDVQEKRRENGAKEKENYNQYIRSHQNGWVFCREGIEEPPQLRSVAFAAINALGLDFGGVDIIYNKAENQCYALEVNTAPGIEGQTISSYQQAIENYVQNH